MTLCERLAAYLTARPARWIDGRELATVAGSYGWRSRISNCRHPPFNLTIENRQRKVETLLGEFVTVSEYRLMPPSAPSGCQCAVLGAEAPCGHCDGPDRLV